MGVHRFIHFRTLAVFIILLIINNTYVIKRNIYENANDELDFANLEIKFRAKGPLSADDPKILPFLRKNYLKPPSSQPYNLSKSRSYLNSKNSFGWKSIHKILLSLFDDTKNGFFVEAGALDGEYLSNSLWLEQNMNWTGLLIEPDGTNFKEMELKHRKAWRSHSCLSDEIFPKEIVFVSTRKKKNSPLLPVLSRGGSFQYNYLNKTKLKEVSTFYENTKFAYGNSVCFPLFSYLLALNQTVIDFLSLDIQGAEIAVFDTIPLNKVLVRSFVVEDTFRKVNYQLIEHFNQLGFNLLTVSYNGPDYFFINRNDFVLMEKTKKMEMLQKKVDEHIPLDIPGLPMS